MATKLYVDGTTGELVVEKENGHEIRYSDRADLARIKRGEYLQIIQAYTGNVIVSDTIYSDLTDSGGTPYASYAALKAALDSYFNTASGGSGASYILDSIKHLDGSSTDVFSEVQRGIDFVIDSIIYDELILPKGTYYLDGELVIDGKIKITGNSTILNIDTSNAQFSVFDKSGDYDITIFGVEVDASSATSANGVRYLNVTGAWDNSTITMINNDFTAFADNMNHYFLYLDDGQSGDKIYLKGNNTLNATLLYYDTNVAGKQVQLLECYNNYVDNPKRWGIRAIDFSPADRNPFVKAIIEDNVITNVNGNLTDLTQVCRMVQVECDDILIIRRNLFDTAITSSGSGNCLYISECDLIFEDNIVKDIYSSTSTAIIDDKGSTSNDRWIIRNNVFDQSNVPTAQRTQAIIRILARQYALIEDNVCRGLESPLVLIYQSVNNGEWPANITMQNNVIESINYPCVFGFTQNSSNCTVKGNVVHSMTNTNSHNHNGRTDPSLVMCYQTFNTVGEGITNLTVSDNVFHFADGILYFIRTWINAAAPDAIMDKIFITNNKCYDFDNFSALCFFVGGATLNDMTNVVSANNVALGMTEDQGLRPADVTQQNNIL